MNTLLNKHYRDYQKISRYSVFPVYFNLEDNKYITGTTAHLYQDASYVNHVVKQGDTWDSISLYYYNNPTYYWVLCDYNRVQDPFVEPAVGSTIKVPTFSNIVFDI